MSVAPIAPERIQARRIGLVADVHGHREGGPPFPDAALAAFRARGVELIVALGDMGESWVLDRFEDVAPVRATRGADDAAADARVAPVRVFQAGGLAIGALFDLSATGIAVTEDARVDPAGKPVADALRTVFGRPVDVVAFASTHREIVAFAQGVLFVNPGSPNLPAPPATPGHGTLAVLDVADGVAGVEIVRL
jgi:putative phosphoesterase